MSDEASPPAPVAAAVPTPAEAEPARPEVVTESEVKEDVFMKDANGNAEISTPKEVATEDAPVESTKEVEQQTNSEDIAQDKPATSQEDFEMKEDTKIDDAAPVAAESSEIATGTPVSAAKAKGGKRKSTGVPEHKGKKLNKKASTAKMTHTDAKPGDYFYVRLKGFPLWPAIVCDESMLPETLLKSRPNGAARPDGTYREGYEDGGAKVKDRQFPVMYMHTNEFGWIPNTDLCDLDPEEVGTVPPKMRKDLAAARTLAAEQNDLEYFKGILKAFMEAREADKRAKEALKAEKQAKKAAGKREKKSAPKAVEEDEDVDLEMADAIGDPESDAAEVAESTKTNKRKAEDTPQGSDSVKKPRTTIKLNTKKDLNGASTPKTPKEATPKAAKPKKSKATPKAAETPKAVVPKEPEMTAEEKRAKKEKEILFLRHKLQKGLLTRDQEPKEMEMRQMSEFIAKLQGYADLEVSIIRATKINKVLKAILKLPFIPREEEYQFKERSQELLDKWNKLLATDTPAVPATSTTTNGNGEAKADIESAKASPTEATNGTKESSTEEKLEEKAEDKPVENPASPEVKDGPADVENPPVEPSEDPKESAPEPAIVESTA
ncbi:PWWP domain-containing protein [Cadophora sp. MPI-SDFR-AT-0126]|nr:PWWP domain-containing protein [Leotiomycetes sp. MPI-SDFR-AT-0126]